MKVVLLHNNFGSTARGGGETVVALEAARLVKAGHEVVVLVPGEKNGFERVDAGYVVRSVVVPLPFLYRDLARHGFVARLFWHLRDMFDRRIADVVVGVLRELKPGVVHTHNMMGLGYRSLRAIGAESSWRHVHTCHDVQLVWPTGLLLVQSQWNVVQRVVYRAYAMVMRKIVGSPATVVFPSKFLMDFYTRFGFFRKSKKEVVMNSVDGVVGASIGDGKTAVSESGVREMPVAPVFLFVGVLEYHKGIRLLLDVWSSVVRVAKRADQVPVLRIVGDGSMLDEVRAAATALNRVIGEEKIVVLGRLGGEVLQNEYRAASWTIVPSMVLENSPTVIAESFALGTPVIASAVGGVPERVQDGENGVLFEAGSGRALYKAVQWAMRIDATEWKKFSAATQKKELFHSDIVSFLFGEK
jgi:glycosyltransferase involved in cell wall biosynthesis